MNSNTFLINEQDLSIGRVALILAMTKGREKEEELKKLFSSMKYQCAITEIGGLQEDIKKKNVSSLIGASLNLNIIDKTPNEIHAVVHASLEAAKGLMIDSPANASYYIKSAIVRKDGWLAIAMFGYSAIHNLSNHERVGLGIMHI